MKRPSGVIAIGILTLLASLFLGYFTLILILLHLVGGELATGSGTLTSLLWGELPFIALTLYAFILSIALLASNSKIVYYSAIVFWVLITLLFAGLAYSELWKDLGNLLSEIRVFGYITLVLIVLSLIPLAYSIGCLTYFNTSKVKEYFKVKHA